MSAELLFRAILKSQTVHHRAFVALRGAIDGFWLGVCTTEQLHGVDAAYYARASNYTDVAYNQSGLSEWEQQALDGHFPRHGNVAVTGAGGGREVFALLQRGYDVVGFECNERLVAFGNELLAAAGHPRRIVLAPRDRWPDGAGTFDGVIVGWGSHMLIQGRERRIEFLRDAHAHLRPRGSILLSFFHRPSNSAYFRWVVRVGNVLRRLLRRELLDMGDALGPEFVHHFTRQEIEEELSHANFDMVLFETEPYAHAVGVAR